MKKLLLLFCFIAAFSSKAQVVIDEANTIVQMEQPDIFHQIYLLSKPIPGITKRWHYLKNVSDTYHQKDYDIQPLLDSTCHGWPTQSVNIFFVNENLGFLYGSTIGYGYCSYMFRTSNGGKNWQTVYLDHKDRVAPSFREALFMFDENRGMALAYILEGKLHYYLTSDGGLTWKRQKIKVSDIKFASNSHDVDGYLKPYYSINGSVLLIGTKTKSVGWPGKQSHDYTVFKSENFGENFRVMK